MGVTPLHGASDGSAGYEVRTAKSSAWIRRRPQRFTCRGVVFAASSLGTMELMFHLKENGSLPAISGKLGKRAAWLRVCNLCGSLRRCGGFQKIYGVRLQ